MSPQIDNRGREWISFYLDEPEGSLGSRVIGFIKDDLKAAAEEMDKFTIRDLAKKIGHNRQRTSKLVERLNIKEELKEIVERNRPTS